MKGPRLISLIVVAALATACGAAASTVAGTHRAAHAAAPAPQPAKIPASPVTTPRPTPLPTATPAPPSPTPTPSTSLSIRPLFPGGASGTIVATVQGAVVQYSITVTGLQPGSAHTIHDHLGSCAAPGASTHLSVLTTAIADGNGLIAFHTSVPTSEFGAGRIVIVYNSARPVLITGCASLG